MKMRSFGALVKEPLLAWWNHLRRGLFPYKLIGKMMLLYVNQLEGNSGHHTLKYQGCNCIWDTFRYFREGRFLAHKTTKNIFYTSSAIVSPMLNFPRYTLECWNTNPGGFNSHRVKWNRVLHCTFFWGSPIVSFNNRLEDCLRGGKLRITRSHRSG